MNSAATVFPLGDEAFSWVQQGGRPTRIGLMQRFLYRWQCYWFERNLSLQRLLQPVSTSPLISDPVFILGLWRSGTTFLHNLLGVCPGMICPATWQCMNPSTFRLRPPPLVSKTVQRPMDGFSIDTFSPQEDEFALLALGAPSVYRGFFDPRRIEELAHWLDPDVWTARGSADWVMLWREFLAGVANGKKGRLLLKSPSHTFRIRALLKEFPGATYIWLVRDPEEAFFSNRKMWVSMFEKYALWEWETSRLDEFLRCSYYHAAQCLAYAASAVQKDRLVIVDFDRLMSNPSETIEDINRRLSLGVWSEMKIAVAQTAAGKAEHRKDTYPGETLTPGLVNAVDLLRAVQKTALASHGL